MGYLSKLVCALAVSFVGVHAAPSCLLRQHRAANVPYSPRTIVNSLNAVVSTPRNGICSGSWPTLSNGRHGDTNRRSAGSLVLSMTRHDDEAHSGAECANALSAIINTCIGDEDYWGGNITADGVEYSIYNEDFPKNWTPEPSLHKSTSSHSTISTTVAAYKTRTLTDVTGVPSSFSQTKTTDSHGHATVLPVWFNTAGDAIILTPIGSAAEQCNIPPPKGLPSVHIGTNGRASKDSPSYKPTPCSRQSTAIAHTTTTSTSEAATAVQLIAPKDRKAQANDALTADLQDNFGDKLIVVAAEQLGVLYWAVPLDSDQVDRYKKHPVVAYITPDFLVDLDEDLAQHAPPHTDHQETRSLELANKTRGARAVEEQNFVHQTDALWELATISHPEGETLPNDDYVYDAHAGEGTRLYLLDTGAYIQHPEFNDLVKQGVSWISIPTYPTRPPDPEPFYDDEGHGTCVLSKVAGVKWGVAKKPSVVIVKIRPGDKPRMRETFSVLGHALQLIYSDVVAAQRKGQKKFILMIAIGMRTPERIHRNAKTFGLDALFEALAGIGVVITVPAGNDFDESPEVDVYPASLAPTVPLIVVGASDKEGNPAPFSQRGEKVTVWAPGQQLTCASNNGNYGQLSDGTSVATAMVAGLAAYLMSVPEFANQIFQEGSGGAPTHMRNLLTKAAYPRIKGGPNIIFNGADWVKPCSTPEGRKRANCGVESPTTVFEGFYRRL
ncbi:MAG: hypothetical protein M4579_002909 [Chaenotheca gracillima]|nr:MAG: hypothetical protein M4579_002909 [Chaenotheca gracillima]